MAFVVQDDTGSISGANSYIDVTFFSSYHLDRGNVIPDGKTTPDIQAACIKATDHIDRRWRWASLPYSSQQTTAWPLLGFYDRRGRDTVGLPFDLKAATAELALLVLQGVPLTVNSTVDETGRQVRSKREKVGPLEEETVYSGGGAVAWPSFPSVSLLLAPYFPVGSSGRAIR